MDEQKEEQRQWEETPDTPISVGATTGLSNKASRETVGVGTQGKKEAEEPAQSDTTEGAEEKKGKDKKNESEVKRMPITKSKEAMLNGEDEVELVDEDNDVQIVDMSMEEQPESLMEARDGLSKLMTKGTTDIWRMKSKMAEQLREYEGRIAAAAAEDDQSRKVRERKAKEREEVMETERFQGVRRQRHRHCGPSATRSW